MKKRIQYIAAALLLCATFGTFGACRKGVVIPDPDPDPIPEPDPSPSVVYGLPEGGTGRYISNSDVLDDGDTRYLVCTTNETQAEEDNVIAVYKAKYEAGEGKGWAYGEQKIVLRGEEGKWDEYIGSASIVKGTFAKEDKNYSWLMAYCATSAANDTQYSIGLAAAASPDGEWEKIGQIVSFNSEVYGTRSVGCYAPSIVNYDKASGIRLFYTYADAYGHFAKFVDFDASDLTDIEISGEAMVPTNGSVAGGDDAVMFPNADFAYDETAGKFVAVKDYSPSAATDPKFATKIQLLSIDEEELLTTDIGEGWLGLRTWDNTDTMNGDTMYERLYGGSVVSDAYGHVNGANGYEIICHVCLEKSESEDYLFTQKPISFLYSAN